jgi:hypothetical protein
VPEGEFAFPSLLNMQIPETRRGFRQNKQYLDLLMLDDSYMPDKRQLVRPCKAVCRPQRALNKAAVVRLARAAHIGSQNVL